MQQPALHLADGHGVLWRQSLQGLDGSHLRGNLVVAPRVACALCVVVAAHVLAIDRPLLQAAHVGLVLQDDGRERLLVDGLILRVFFQQVDEVAVGLGHFLGQLAAVDGADVEPLQGAEAGEGLLIAFLFLLLHLVHQFHDVVAQIAEGLVEHLLRLILRAGHGVQAHQHLGHRGGHPYRALHAGPPAPRAIAILQLVEVLHGGGYSLADEVLVEEVGQPLLLLLFAVGIHHPGRLAEHHVLQLLVFAEVAHQRRLGSLLAAPLLKDMFCRRVLVKDMAADAVGVERCGLADGAVVVGMSHGGQCLNHHPCGVVGVFNGELCLRIVDGNQL